MAQKIDILPIQSEAMAPLPTGHENIFKFKGTVKDQTSLLFNLHRKKTWEKNIIYCKYPPS